VNEVVTTRDIYEKGRMNGRKYKKICGMIDFFAYFRKKNTVTQKDHSLKPHSSRFILLDHLKEMLTGCLRALG
jgi:hypothetical protein